MSILLVLYGHTALVKSGEQQIFYTSIIPLVLNYLQ
jgi:hypothetical protein